MNLASVSLRNLRVRSLSGCLTTASIALGTGLLAALWMLLAQTELKYQANVKGYGVVVGPKEGSGLDLVLSTVFNFTELAPPTGLVPLSVYRELHDGALRKKFAVRYAIPQCRGDSFRGFPVIGTTDEMFTKFARGKSAGAHGERADQPLEFAVGGPFAFSHAELLAFADHMAEERGAQSGSSADHDHEIPAAWRRAVVGAAVARKLDLAVGHRITPVHGVADEITAHVHAEAECEVVGVLADTGTPLDRSIFIPIGAFLSMAKHDAIRATQQAAADNVGLSAIVVDTLRPTQFGQRLRYEFQTRSDAQAVVPWFEVTRLLKIVGDAADLLRVVSYLVLVVAAITIFVSLYNTMNERRREIAIMRSLGARRAQIVAVILMEAMLVSLAGAVLGIALCHAAALVFAEKVVQTTGVALAWQSFSLAEAWLIVGVTVLGGLAGILPAIKGSLTPIADHLGPIS